MSLDDLRARYPHLGFAVYAIEPGGPVTLEVHTPDGTVFTTVGPTEAAAIARRFPPEPEAPPSPPAAPSPTNVFD